MKPNARTVGLAILVLIGAVLIATYVHPLNQSILPSFEGLNAGVQGANIGGTFYRIDQPPAYGYTWVSSDPKSTVLLGPSNNEVRAELNNPELSTDPFTVGKTVSYWVKNGDGTYTNVVGQINVYNLNVAISAVRVQTPFELNGWFQGQQLWFSLAAVNWNQALQRQGAAYGTAYEAPLAVIISGYNVQDPGDHAQLDPSVQGRWMTLYNSPAQIGTISDLGLQSGQDINGTLAGNNSPDSRLSQTAYFAITLTDFGVTDHLYFVNSPVASYTLKVYTIQIGKYTYTNPDNTPFAQRQPESVNPFAGIEAWLANPFNLAALVGTSVLTFLLIIIAVTAVALFWFFGLPRGLGRRKD